ncbi:hypothetical protein CE143_14960 [Photorhabdus luminescens]|uniref:Uncharacterized protein n=2 Tax=Photorhabdus TaxID=29487 RepID=A0A1B8YFJ5_9GAMM|nr:MULTISPECIES: hypothetical protein [Photorhabdus]OCA53913.1 hypothetical protein Phpb_03017 [Photorhabdus namnaonensis]QXF34305.1 hypothetical protein B0X70_14965 [Photorhabdus akhurstii]UJD76129.1 hypothetical protein CE143_14960 [Photorhabdus luminescens]
MPSIHEDFELITAEILSEYFDSKGVTPHCMLCGHASLSVPQVSAGCNMPINMKLGTYVNVFKAESIYHENANNFYILVACKKCGNTMTIDAVQVLEWIKQKYPAIIEEDSDE